MKITVLANDWTNSGLPAEHGLSLLVEADGKRILVDAGTGDTIISNAAKLDIDLEQIDFIILSHGHYDHTDGLLKLPLHGQKIFAHKNALKERFRLLPDGFDFNGISWREKIHADISLVLNDKITEISKNVVLSGALLRPFGTPKNNFFEDDKGMKPDLIEDEQLIIFNQPDGLVVVSGCTHFGVENMTYFIKQNFPGRRVKALFAGLHTKKMNDVELMNIIKHFSEAEIYCKIYALHCTGEKMGRIIEKEFGGKLLSVGDCVVI